MTESNFSLEKLKAENFSLQSELSAKNQRTLEKMFRYLRTFPLEETQIELLRQDLIGMAREAEMRQELFLEPLANLLFPSAMTYSLPQA